MSFISEEQDNCRISILSLAHIADDLRELSPISHLTSRDHVRVDPQSSAWILGKLLKMLVFTQSQYISGLDLNGENILINRRQHYVTLFAWTEAILGNGEISPMIAQDEIAKVAFEVRIILGGDPTTGKLPPDKQLPDDQYENFIRSLIAGREKDASEAHRKCYELIHSLWPRKFHEFTTYSI